MRIKPYLCLACLWLSLPAIGAPTGINIVMPTEIPAAAVPTVTASVAPAMMPNIERDPFEVSPRLREGHSRIGTDSYMENAALLKRELKLKALARGHGGGVAQIQWNKEIITANDGDELEFDGNRYLVKIDGDGLLLRGTSAPQYKIRVR